MDSLKYFAISLLLVMVWQPAANAEIYRWVDDNGKVHYSDRKPAAQPAEDISDTTKRTNIDDSQSEQAKLGKIFAKETAAEKQARERAAIEAHNQQVRHNNACKKLKRRLEIISGRTYWTNGKGKEWDMTLEEQKQEKARVEAEYRQHCQ